MIDPDVPIPYTITPAGRRDLEVWREEAAHDYCQHEWHVHRGVLSCDNCGLVRELPRSHSIPSHIGIKRRND